jgi:putative Holliday junction resolvase
MADPSVTLDELFARLSPGQRLIGLDLGTTTIGLALSDLGHRIATPLETIRRVKFGKDVSLLLAICGKHNIGGLIMGLPLNMDGSEGPRVQATRSFVRNLAPLTPLPLAYWDERLSTAAVTRTLIAADTSRTRRAEVVDKMAAAFILQGALDRMSRAARHQEAEARDALPTEPTDDPDAS